MKKIQIVILTGILLLSLGCRKRLDSFLFNNKKTDQYLLDDYDDPEIELPGGYHVPSNAIHQFTFKIEDKGESLNIAAIYIGDLNTIHTDTVILYCHGNADNMDHYWTRQKLLSHVGGFGRYGVLMFDYPGYGMSDGNPTEENMYASANGALKWLKNKGLNNKRLIVYGYSLGSAPACKAVGDKSFVLQPQKIILESPFASSQVMVQDATLINMPSSYFVNAKINNAEQIKECDVPLYWIHGVDDDFLSIETHGRVVYSNHSKSWKMKNEVQGAGHSNVPIFMGFDTYKERILTFVVKEN